MEKKKFYRNTHKKNGKFRKELKDVDTTPGLSIGTLSMHLLDHKDGMSFDELMESYKAYVEQYPQDFPGFNMEQLSATIALEVVEGLQDTTITAR